MTKRQATITDASDDAAVTVSLTLDGSGQCEIASGLAAFDRLLRLFAKQAKVDIKADIQSVGAPAAQTIEAIGHCLGLALAGALGDKKGINRYASALVPLEEALIRVALDLSGRPYLVWNAPASMDAFAREFVRRFIMAGGINMHVDVLEPGAAHHVVDAVFAAVGRAVGNAVALDPRETGVPSSKGVL